MKINYAARVEIGTRETNDDRILIDTQILNMNSFSGTLNFPAVAIVCDGCGGYMGGGDAAQETLELISYEDINSLSNQAYLAKVLDNCNTAIIERQKENPQYSEMCTTIAGIVFCDDKYIIFHSGDSRVYRYDKWGLAKMTKDHSTVQDMIDMGEISPEEAKEHPLRSVINRCIGAEGTTAEIHESIRPAIIGDKYLLCSDGLWEYLETYEIEEVLNSNLSLREMVDTLVEKALVKESDDNISVCICSIEE